MKLPILRWKSVGPNEYCLINTQEPVYYATISKVRVLGRPVFKWETSVAQGYDSGKAKSLGSAKINAKKAVLKILSFRTP